MTDIACDIDLEAFLDAYIATALWSTNDESGEPLDDNHDESNIDPETLVRMRADCAAFLAHPNGGRLIEIAIRLQDEGKYVCPADDRDVAGYAAHDFWLTRNGHGCGFWETEDWPKGMGATLSETAKEFGEFNLFVGDNGTIDGY